MDPGTVSEPVDGITTREPTYGLPAIWVKGRAKEKAIASGYTVVDPATVMTTHLSDVVRRYAHELVGRQEVQQMLDHLKKTHPKVVDELVPNLLPLGAVVRVLQNLLREQVPVRDLLAVLETMGDWATTVKDTDLLTEYVRQTLSRTITRLHLTETGSLPVVSLGIIWSRSWPVRSSRPSKGGFWWSTRPPWSWSSSVWPASWKGSLPTVNDRCCSVPPISVSRSKSCSTAISRIWWCWPTKRSCRIPRYGRWALWS